VTWYATADSSTPWCSPRTQTMAIITVTISISHRGPLDAFIILPPYLAVFDMVSDSLRNINILIYFKKLFSNQNYFMKLFDSFVENILYSIEMRRKRIRITWNTCFSVSLLEANILKRSTPIHHRNVSIFSLCTVTTEGLFDSHGMIPILICLYV
jgi:hypothetical protein